MHSFYFFQPHFGTGNFRLLNSHTGLVVVLFCISVLIGLQFDCSWLTFLCLLTGRHFQTLTPFFSVYTVLLLLVRSPSLIILVHSLQTHDLCCCSGYTLCLRPCSSVVFLRRGCCVVALFSGIPAVVAFSLCSKIIILHGGLLVSHFFVETCYSIILCSDCYGSTFSIMTHCHLFLHSICLVYLPMYAIPVYWCALLPILYVYTVLCYIFLCCTLLPCLLCILGVIRENGMTSFGCVMRAFARLVLLCRYLPHPQHLRAFYHHRAGRRHPILF